MPNISSYGSASNKNGKKGPKKTKPSPKPYQPKKNTAMNNPNVRGGMSQSTMRSTPKKRK